LLESLLIHQVPQDLSRLGARDRKMVAVIALYLVGDQCKHGRERVRLVVTDDVEQLVHQGHHLVVVGVGTDRAYRNLRDERVPSFCCALSIEVGAVHRQLRL